MRPCRLVFSGVNSFSERAEIDFEKLISSGLFGIFGETGSGKSTILDCINFALYGNVDRSKKKTDIINYNCEQAEVEFEFTLLTGGVRKRYRVERSIKKKSGLGKAMLYVEYDGKSECVADNTTSVNAAVEELIGLNAEDFRKCIALPQGEFAQFVTCAPSERFRIIERLFSLSRYGEVLKERLNKRESEIEAQYLTAAGELSAYSDVTSERIEECKTKLEADRKILVQLEEQGKHLKQTADRLSGVYKSKMELESAEADFEKLNARRQEMENLRNLLKSEQQCRRVKETSEELELKKNLLSAENSQLITLKSELQSVSTEVEKLSAEFDSADYDEKTVLLREKLASFEAAKADIDELAECDNKLRILREKFKTAVINGDRLRDEELAAYKAAQYAQQALDGCEKQDLSEILEIKLKPAILRSEYNAQMVYLAELRDSIKGYDDGGELYKFLREELTDRIKYYEQIILTLEKGKVDVNKVISAFKEQDALREKLLKDNSLKREKLAECRQKTAVSDSEINNLKREGEEHKNRYLKLKEKLDALFGEDNNGYSAAIQKLKEDIANLTAEKNNAAKSLELAKRRVEELKILNEKASVKINGLQQDVISLTVKSEQAVKESGYKDIDEVFAALQILSSHGDAAVELASYDERTVALKSRITALNAVEGIKNINKEQVEKACSELREWEVAVKEKHAEVRLGENNFALLSEKLEQKSKNEKALKVIESERNLVSQLKELTRGNKFLEYIAGEYLSDVSKAASVTLLKLTSGRYFLSYEDNFYVGDNYNEGKKRGVNTLSGGEIFLVSLSLALALSSAICRGSLRSIEFFFLDEGFGTLDEALVDTVMDSLEKLRSSEFTIGIISHVEELKHRIENKIIVNKTTETHGSTVNVCV